MSFAVQARHPFGRDLLADRVGELAGGKQPAGSADGSSTAPSGCRGVPGDTGCDRLMADDTRSADPLGRPPVSSLRPLIDPKSIAVIGASNDPARIGGRPLAYIKRAGFQGAILPVNPNRTEVQGLPAYASVADLPEVPDACIVAVPAALVGDTLEACVAKGIRGAVIFRQVSRKWARRSRRASPVRRIARTGACAYLGPTASACSTRTAVGWRVSPLLSTRICRCRGRCGRKPVRCVWNACVCTSTTGWCRNRYPDYHRERGGCRSCRRDRLSRRRRPHPRYRRLCRGIRDGDALRAALEKAADARKPVILMKVGKSEVGAPLPLHTPPLAGSDRVYDALFRQYGVLRVDTTDQMIDAAYAAARAVFPNGDRIGLMSISGGVGVQMADAAADLALDVAPMPEAAQNKLLELLPFASARNPVDVTAQAFNDISMISKNLWIMLEEGNYDAIVAFFTMIASSKYIADDLIGALEQASKRYPNKVMLLSLIGDKEIVDYYEKGGYLVFEDPTRAVSAAAALMRFGQFFARIDGEAPPERPEAALSVPPVRLSETGAMDILASWGCPVHALWRATGPEKAARLAEEFGRRVVLKIVSPDIAHKTDVGGVVIGVEGRCS